MSCVDHYVVREASSFSVMYRIQADGANVTQSDVSSIQYAVINDGTKEVITSLASLTVSSVVFDTLQTDDRWTEDNTGYNFRHDVDQSVLTNPDISYRFEYKVTLSSGNEFWLKPFVINVDEIYGN